MILKTVRKFIEKHRLFAGGEKVLVALSGGADSVALLRILRELEQPCEAAHCNFHLRGEESDRDERFVRELCARLGVELHVTHFDTRAEAARSGESIEMAARRLRYAWFEELRQRQGAACVAVAHHQDDSAETLLLNLLRGTGLAGLRGIHARNGYIVRPLLCLSRSDLEQYLEEAGQEYVTDSTNRQDEYLRNKIRLHLLPLMEEINPAARANLLRTAVHLDEAYLYYKKGIDEAMRAVQGEGFIRIPELLRQPAPTTLLHELLAPLGFNERQTGDVLRTLTATSGKQFVSTTHRLLTDRDRLLILPLTEPQPSKPELCFEEHLYTPDFVIPRDKRVACFDADTLTGEFTLRLAAEGDWFIPFGMKGRKLLSDYMTDRKFSLLRKRSQWVLCCGADICWLVGERSDNRFRVTERTRRVICVSY